MDEMRDDRNEPVAPTLSREERLHDYGKALLRRLWVTKGIRFDSSRRYETKQRASNLAISILSVYVIAFALIELIAKSVASDTAKLFPLITIIAPVLILVLSQHESQKGYLVQAERMYKSAQQIEKLHSQLELALACGSPTVDELDRIRATYEEIIHDSFVNHDNVDYFFFQALHPRVFKAPSYWGGLRMRFRGRVLHMWDVWGMPFLVTLLPALLFYYPIQALVQARAS
jgi:hypothetical protein